MDCALLVFPLGEAHGRVEVDVVREECLEGGLTGGREQMSYYSQGECCQAS